MDDRIEDVREKKTYLPANECIYCGARDVPLTDEHTFPDGMGGRHILPKAVCKVCQKIINEEFEQYCQRTLFSHMRAIVGMKSSKKSKPVRHSIQVKTHSGEIQRIYGDPADLPLVVALPAFPKPFFLTGQKLEGDSFPGGAWWRYCEPPIEQVVKDLSVASVITNRIFPEKLARFHCEDRTRAGVGALGAGLRALSPSDHLGERHQVHHLRRRLGQSDRS